MGQELSQALRDLARIFADRAAHGKAVAIEAAAVAHVTLSLSLCAELAERQEAELKELRAIALTPFCGRAQ